MAAVEIQERGADSRAAQLAAEFDIAEVVAAVRLVGTNNPGLIECEFGRRAGLWEVVDGIGMVVVAHQGKM